MGESSDVDRKLARELRSLQRSADRPVLDEALVVYLRTVRARLGQTYVMMGPGRRENVSLEDIYVPVPVDVAMSVRVQSGTIAEAWLEDNTEAAQLLAEGQTNLPGWAGTDRTPTFDSAEATGIAHIRDTVAEVISQGADADHEDPTTRPLIAAPPWYDGTRHRFWPLYAEDAVALWHRLILLGAPGSGKSTFLRYLAQHQAAALLGSAADDRNLCGQRIPIYLELRKVFGVGDGIDIDVKVDENIVWNYLREDLEHIGLSAVTEILRREALNGRAIIMLDGIDEVPIPSVPGAQERRRVQLQSLARTVNTLFPESQVVISGRDYSYRGWRIDGFDRVTINPLRGPDIKRLLSNLGRKRSLEGKHLDNEVIALRRALEDVPEALRSYPLFVSLMASLYWAERRSALPGTRSELYRESVDLLLERWSSDDQGQPSLTNQLGCSREELEHRLRRVAFQTHRHGGDPGGAVLEIEYPVLVTELFRLGQQADPHKVLAYLSEYAGVLIAHAPEIFRFAHRGFQEFFAAGYIADLLDIGHREGRWTAACSDARQVFESSPQVWREPFLLLGEILNAHGKQDQAWNLIAELASDRRVGSLNSGDAHDKWSYWLASRIILDSKMYERVGIREGAVVKELKRGLVGILSGRELPAPERADCGECIGVLGDTRPGTGIGSHGYPDPLMCPIESGSVILGTSSQEAEAVIVHPWARGWTFGRETPVSEIYFEEFAISKYPITVAQFEAFLSNGDGYDNEAWWIPAGLEWKRSSGGPVPPQWGQVGNLPRTNVSWFEAQAFCKWFSWIRGEIFRLPTEAEWEYAAKANSAGWFQWGNEFDIQACNSSASGFGHPVSVGCYEGYIRQSSETPVDICGNIWEWTSTAVTRVDGTDFAYPYSASDGREDDGLVHKASYRVVRGGSYVNPPFLLRIAYRGRDEPIAQVGRTGFRIVKVVDKGTKI